MDEDSDDELALSNLHHGLESSFDEDMNGSGKRSMRSVHHSNSVDSHNEDMATENHIHSLQDMVLEMKQGFQAALQELAKIQDKEEAEGNHSQQLQQQQQRQLDHMTETIVEIKEQLSSLTRNVEQIMDEQKTLKSRLDEVASSRDSSQENKMSVDRGSSSKRPSLVDYNSTHSEEWNLKSTSQPAETGTNRTVNEGTAVACKGINLMQGLGEEGLKLNLSQSSNDEEDDEQLLRLSRYGHKTGHHIFSQTTDRQHNKSGNLGPQDRHKTIINAAQRQKSVMELADSERDYTSQLWSLLRTYLTPLQTAGFLSARELDTLFPVYLEQLYAEHCHICTGLQDRLIHWTYTATVADLLERLTDSYNSESLLSLYKEYADDLPAALSCLRRAQAKSSEFRSFLKAVQHSSCQSESLMSLLMAPFQRIPKLLQQLQEVCRHTPATHTDFPHLQSLLHQLQLFVDQLNDDLFHTAQDLSSDKQTSRSDYMNGHGLNGRDSGIHSNSTEEDNLISARALSKTRRGYVSSEWLDNPYHDANIKQPWSPSGRASALSQPDLTVYSSMDRVITDPLEYAHIPRSQSALPTADGDDDGSETAARRQMQKFKIKRRYPSPVGYTTTQDHNHRSLSPRVRPSSAVDFLSQSQHQHYHKHNSGDIYGGARSYQYPGPKPRPQSALGPHNLNSSHRPVVISRKNIRRPQPSVPTSNTSWSETKTPSALPFRAGHQKTNLAAEDLFPAFSISQRRADVFDGHDGDDDDADDTRASDAISCDMYEYRRNSHSHGVSNRYEIGQNLPQAHVSYQIAKSSSLTYDTAKSAESIAEKVTENPTRRTYTSKQETATDNRGIRRDSKDMQNPKSISVLQYQPSQSVASQRNDNSDIQELHVSQAEAKNIERPTGNSAHTPGLEQRNAKEQTTLNESSLLNEVFFNGNNSATSVSSSGFNVSQEGDELSAKRHIVKAVPKPASAIDHHAEIDRSKHVSETNRQFLLMLSNRTSTMSKGDLAHPLSVGANNEHSGGNVVEISNKSPTASDTSESFSSDHTSTSRRGLPYIPPRHKIANSQVNQAAIATATINQGSTKPSLPPKKHLKHCASSPPASQDGGQAPLDIPDSESLFKYDHNSPQTLSSSSTTYPQSPSIPSQNASILSQISLSLEHQHSPSRLMPLYTSSTTSMPPSPAELPVPSKVTGQNPDDRIYSSSHDPQPLNLADLDVNGEKGRRRGSLKYKMKDEGSNLSSDNHSMASEDQANVRRKMHFKASLKNLFAKKKGRVVLADIERQVVKEMASTGATGGARGSTSTSVVSPALTNFAHSSSRHLAKIKCSQTGDTGTSHKTSGKPLIEVKTQKDQGSSTSSPVKMYERIKFRTRREKDADNVNGCEQVKTTDCEQDQQEKNMLKCLSLHNKRHGIILENPDTDLEKILEAGADSVRSPEQGNSRSRHSYTQDRACSDQSHLLQRPHSEIMACAAFSDGAQSHAKHGDKRILLEQVQDQNYVRNCMEIRKATTSCEPDLLQFASGYKNNKHKVTHTTCKDKAVSSSGASDNELSSQRSTGYRLKEHDLKKSQLPGFDLCLQCQKNELRHMETTEAVDNRSKFGSCEIPDGSVEMSEKASDNARNYPSKVVPEYRSFGDGSYTVAQASSLPHCMLHGVWDPRPAAEQIKQFSYIDDPAVSSSSADSADDKLEDETCRNSTMPDAFPGSCYVQRIKKEKLGERSRFSTLLPVYELPSPKSNQAAHSMPDVAKCSTLVANWSDNNIMSSSSTEVTQVSGPPAGLLGNNADLGQTRGLELSNTLDTKASLISSASTELVTNIQVSSSPFHVSSSHQKRGPSEKLDHGVIDSHPLASAETVSGETILNNQLPTSTNEVSPKCDPNEESCKNVAKAEGDSEILVKCSSLEDRESFEHRYRLYYDDENDASKLHSLLENPKSLKVLSATCVIHEHFRQSPWNETSSCFKNHPPSSEQLPLLTLEVPLINIRDKGQQTSNSASSHEGCADGNPDGQNVAVYTARHLPYSSDIGTAVLNICRAQTSTQLSVDSSLAGRLSLHNPTDLANNTGVVGTGTSHTDRLAASDKNPPPVLSKRHQEVILKLNDNETSLKLPPVCNGCEEDAKNVKPVVLDSYQGHSASSPAVDDDESNSYKPKNPRPISQIANSVECQTAECLRRDGFGSEDSPGAPGIGVGSKHSLVLESETAVSSSYTKSASFNQEPLLHSSINQAAGKTYNQLHAHIQVDQNPLYVESCTTRRSWSFSKGRDPSSTDASSEAATRAVSPVVYYCKQSAEDPFLQEGCTFLRTSSPYDPTTLRMNWPKKPAASPSHTDHAESTNSPGSTTPISPESDRTTTKDITKSPSKEVLVEKEDKGPRHTAYGRMKATFEEDNNCQKSCKRWASPDASSSAPSNNHNGTSRRHRHSNGSKFRCQEQQFYQSQNPRYSADSNPLIQTAFLQKMACLPEYVIKQGGNFAVDEKTSYTMKAKSRHSKIHFDVTRKSYGPIDGKSSRTARNNPSTKASSWSGVNSEAAEADSGHSSYEHYHQRANTGSTAPDIAQASPDLLPSKEPSREDVNAKDKTSACKKAQSFFSKLTNSPMSFFYKESKPFNPPN